MCSSDLSLKNLYTEIGLLFTLPAYQGTHVTTNAVGLLMHWCFDELGMRRVQWRSAAENVPSVRVAERLGFQKEMVMRWTSALTEGKAGEDVREEDPRPANRGCHILYLSICWDDWVEWKEKVQDVMDRR